MDFVRSYGASFSVALLLLAFPVTNYNLQREDLVHQLHRGWGLVYPDSSAVVLHDNILLLVIKVDTAKVSSLKVYAPWDSSISIEPTSIRGGGIPRDKIATALPSDLLLKQITIRIAPYHQPADTVIDSFYFSQKVVAREFFLNDTSR
ncbi:MAG: hypothetical protein ACP5ON_05575, partial [Bacteroidota bacterium]